MSQILDNRMLLNQLKRDEGFTIHTKKQVSTYILEVRLIKLVRNNLQYLNDEDITDLKIKNIVSYESFVSYIQNKIKNFSSEKLEETQMILEKKGVIILLLFLMKRFKIVKK